MADQLRERIRLRGQQRLVLDDQVLVARRVKLRHEVDRQGSRRCAVIRGRELVDNGRDVRGRVLRGLRVLGNLGRDQDFYVNCHVSPKR